MSDLCRPHNLHRRRQQCKDRRRHRQEKASVRQVLLCDLPLLNNNKTGRRFTAQLEPRHKGKTAISRDKHPVRTLTVRSDKPDRRSHPVRLEAPVLPPLDHLPHLALLRPDQEDNLSNALETVRKGRGKDRVAVLREIDRVFQDKVDDPIINSAAEMPDLQRLPRPNRSRCDPS